MSLKNDIMFWDSILFDHANFLMNGFSVNEVEFIEKSNYFYNEFKKRLSNIPTLNFDMNKDNIVSETKDLINRFIQFKQEIITGILKCDLKISHSATFVNHMINEALEYYRLLSIYDQSLHVDDKLENLRTHKIWLADASGHAFHIASQLDNIEDVLLKEALEFRDVFNGLFIEASELYSLYERITLDNGNLVLFNQKVKLIMESFVNFLNELIVLKGECKIITTGLFNKEVPEHMKNESVYYLSKIDKYLKNHL